MPTQRQQDGNYLQGVQCPNCGHFEAKYSGFFGCVGQLVAIVAVFIAFFAVYTWISQSSPAALLVGLVGALVLLLVGMAIPARFGGKGCTNCGYRWK